MVHIPREEDVAELLRHRHAPARFARVPPEIGVVDRATVDPTPTFWRVMATVLVCPATVYVMEPLFVSVKVTERLPAAETLSRAGLKFTPKKAGPLTW